MPEKESEKNSALAVAAFILSLLFFIPFLPLVGVILGIAALVKISRGEVKGKSFAIAGIIIGVGILVLQIFLFVSISNFFGSFFGGIMTSVEKGPVEGMNVCLEEEPGPMKDMCVMMVLSMHANQTEELDVGVCDEVQDEGTKNYCNAILRKDKSYCYNIEVAQTRINCLGMLEELERTE